MTSCKLQEAQNAQGEQKTQSLQKGLYQSQYEHDACGVGMVVNIHGGKSHELVDNALKVLENMEHRGAETRDKPPRPSKTPCSPAPSPDAVPLPPEKALPPGSDDSRAR